jgi:hypothetical protein
MYYMMLLTPRHMMTLVVELGMPPSMTLTEEDSNEWNQRHNHQDFIHAKMKRHLYSPALLVGIEPTTLRLEGACSNPLSYRSINGTTYSRPT